MIVEGAGRSRGVGCLFCLVSRDGCARPVPVTISRGLAARLQRHHQRDTDMFHDMFVH